jgi:hypothetical protein
MACVNLQHMNNATLECTSIGGVKRALIGKRSSFNWVTTAGSMTANKLTALPTLTTVGTTPLYKFSPNKKGFKGDMTKDNRNATFVFNLAYYFDSITGDIRAALSNNGQCCALVIFLELWDGTILFVGMDWDGTEFLSYDVPIAFESQVATTGEYGTGNADSSPRTSGTIAGEAAYLWVETTLTYAGFSSIIAP